MAVKFNQEMLDKAFSQIKEFKLNSHQIHTLNKIK